MSKLRHLSSLPIYNILRLHPLILFSMTYLIRILINTCGLRHGSIVSTRYLTTLLGESW